MCAIEMCVNGILPKNKNKNKIEGKNQNKIMRDKSKLKKNSNLDIHQEGGFQTFLKILDSKILGRGNY